MNNRFNQMNDQMNDRFDKIDKRLDKVENRLTVVEQDMEDRPSVGNVSGEFLIISNSYPILEILFKLILNLYYLN